MAEKLTPQQYMAVKDRGGKLLVSAAAGSGKTKVLVDRLMDYVLDPVDPANLDEFLIITYTKAAASELRGKIAAKLTQHIAHNPENRHLQRQMQRLYLAKISTVHAFCGDILREYAYMLDLPADFRVADENECSQLRERVMERMLDAAYENAENDPDFRAFTDAQGLGRDDRLVSQILLKVYDSARCHLDPVSWLDKCVQNTQVETLEDAAQTVWGNYLLQELKEYLSLQIDAMERCAALAETAEGMEKPAALLHQTVLQLRHLYESSGWDDVVTRKNVDFGRLTISKKCPDQELAERIKAARNACKKGLEKKMKAFVDLSEQVLADMTETAPSVRGMVQLVRRFGSDFDRAKRSRRILDFGDLEHRMLDLLLGKSRSGPTGAAAEIAGRFREIMVDEYQDSNAVQDAIFGTLTQKRNNCFMVGDVKQSIYQFRLADPGIFLRKYNTFSEASIAAPGEDRKVLLSANFRSGGAVLRSVNDVFALCMSPQVGGLYYGEEEALKEGIPHGSLGEEEVELWGIDVQENTYEEEAAFVAKRIAELTDGSHYVRDSERLRPIQPDDVAILLRSPGSIGRYYMDALMAVGIRCTSGGGEDLLQTEEIATLRSLLQTISNPRQDIPLIATLASPVFCFTADELSAIRGRNRTGCFYDAVCQTDSVRTKDFIQKLNILRKEARMNTLAQLIEKIFLMTGMDSIYAAMEDGENKRENLQAFYALAVSFESTARHDLEQFLEHLQAMEDKGLIASGEQSAAGAVTLMSIHKSKGLEFPVVFCCGLSREFNRESARQQVLCDQELGLGVSVVDGQNRLRYPTVAKRAIAAKITADGLSEEMRVLYVALTRAKDRLIMTYASQSLQKDLTEIALRMRQSQPQLLAMDVVCPGEWILMTALKRTEAGAFFRLCGSPGETTLGDPVWKIGVVTTNAEMTAAIQEQAEPESLAEEFSRKLGTGLAYQYPYMASTGAPSKQTATQRKGRLKDDEVAEQAEQNIKAVRTWRKPSFMIQPTDGVEKGNAVHALMQHIDYMDCSDAVAVSQQVNRLVQQNYLTLQQAQLIDCDAVAVFFRSDLGQRLQKCNRVLREFKFSILDPAEYYDPSLIGEKILLQGVVDCLMIEDDGITVIDFKTDYVTSKMLQERVDHYRPQVQAYAQAMEKIWQKPLKEALLYFFYSADTVKVQ